MTNRLSDYPLTDRVQRFSIGNVACRQTVGQPAFVAYPVAIGSTNAVTPPALYDLYRVAYERAKIEVEHRRQARALAYQWN